MPKNNPKCFQERSQRSIHGPPSLGQGSRAGTRPAPPHLFSVGSEPSQQGQGASWGAQHVPLGGAAHREASCSARGLGPSIPTGWLVSVLLWGEKLGDAADPPGAGNGSGSSDKAPACSRAVPAAGTRGIWLRCAGGDGVRRAPAQPSLTLPTALYFPPCSKILFFFSPQTTVGFSRRSQKPKPARRAWAPAPVTAQGATERGSTHGILGRRVANASSQPSPAPPRRGSGTWGALRTAEDPKRADPTRALGPLLFPREEAGGPGRRR